MKKLRKSEKYHYITYSHKKKPRPYQKITKLGKKNLENQWKIQDIIKRSRLYSKSCTSPSRNTGKNQSKSYKKQNKSYKI